MVIFTLVGTMCDKYFVVYCRKWFVKLHTIKTIVQNLPIFKYNFTLNFIENIGEEFSVCYI